MIAPQKRSRREYEADLKRKQDAPYVIYGTPLPALDDNARDDGSYLPVWKQEVTDDKGRKRLHGAFTGGFSAGYFNSVGSKEGWAPSTFVSSRSNRAKDAKDVRQQKVEDFMDEEDVREQEEARELSLRDESAGFGTVGERRDVLDDIFRPVETSMGERLLTRMGWKQGQGIGPRISRKIDPNNPESEVREFPPEDSPMLEYVQRNDTQGLGFGDESVSIRSAAVKTSDLETDESRPGLSFMARPKKKLVKPRTGFGVGSLNDTGSDDEDPYETGPKVSLARLEKKKPKKMANPLLKQTPTFTKKLPTSLTSLRKCHDGKLPINGFVLAEEFGNISLAEQYPPPIPPADWQPSRLSTTPQSSIQLNNQLQRQNHTQQTAESRRNLLGETSLPSKSVFDFLSPAARDKLAQATGNQNLPPALDERPESHSTPEPPKSGYPVIDVETATTALQRLRKDKSPPYNDDLPKQTRYKDFLRWSADPLPEHQRVPPLRKGTEAEHRAECEEFAATASLFKPATGFLATRFTAGKANKEEAEIKVRDPAEEAAEMGMFGIATRRSQGWRPTKMVCKRFGVEMPVVMD